MSNIKSQSVKGIFWLSVGKVGTGLSSLAVNVILARILMPSDFALIALLTIFIAVSNVFLDSGFSQAIIREPEVTKKDLSTVFYFNFGISLFIYFILFFCSPLIAEFYDAPALVSLSRVTFLVIIFNSLVIVQNAILTRDLNFKIISQANIGGTFGAGLIAVLFIFLGFGIWSIVANIVLQPFFKSLILWYCSKWRPSLIFCVNSLKKFFSFGVFLMFQGLLDSIVTNLSELIIGRVYTKTDLGFYSQGFKFNGYVTTPFVSVIEKVTYPITSRLHSKGVHYKDVNVKLIQLIVFFFMPLSIFACYYGEEIILAVFGSKWEESAIYFSIATITGLFYPIQRLSANIIQVKGKTKEMFYWAIAKQSLRLIGILSLYKLGIVYMAVGFLITGIIGGLFYSNLAFKLINYEWLSFLKDQMLTILITTISLVITMIINNFLSLSHIITIIVLVIVMGLSFLLLAYSLKHPCVKLLKFN